MMTMDFFKWLDVPELRCALLKNVFFRAIQTNHHSLYWYSSIFHGAHS